MGVQRIQTLVLATVAVAIGLAAAPAAATVREHLPPEAGSSSPAYAVSAKPGGEVYEFGSARFAGSASGISRSERPVGIAATASSQGYWLAFADGAVLAFGDAAVASVALGSKIDIVDIEAHPQGAGFWLVSSTGRVLARGGARSFGSMGAEESHVIAIEPTASGAGYWLLTGGGQVEAFGDATHYGDLAQAAEVEPVDIVRAGSGDGYWIIETDGTVHSFGGAARLGSRSEAGDHFVAGAAHGQDGLWLTTANGRVVALGSAGQLGGALAGPDEPIIGIAATSDARGYWLLSGPGESWLGPQVPDHDGSGQRIVYALGEQRIWLVNPDGTVFDSYLVSGKAGTPRPGEYSVYSKSRNAFAAHDGITMDHMVRFAHGKTLAIGFHSIPIYADGRPMQTVEQLGTYRSSGCVRQRNDQAERLYNWAPIGTPVFVLI